MSVRRLGIVLLGLTLTACPRRDGGGEAALGTTAKEATSTARGPSGTPKDLILRAEDLRRAGDVTDEVRASHDVVERRLAARALSRIADAKSTETLGPMLADEDPEVVAWAAYGLGYACKGNEEAHVAMLVARSVSLAPMVETGRSPVAAHGAIELDPHVAIARAVGKCGAPTVSERTLVVWLGQGPAWRDAATLGLGDLATLGKELGDAATTALLDTIETHDGPPNDMAFYALSRGSVRPALRARVVRAAKAALSRPGDARLFAIKTIARWSAVDANGAADLADVVTRPTNFTLAERAEAARALGVMGAAGHEAAAGALATLSPMRDVSVLLSGEYHVLHLLVGALGEAPPASIEPTLFALASLKPPSPRDPKLARPLARRVAELRCASALGLARGVSDAEVLLQCDDRASEISERARLTALLRRPLDRDRRVAFRAFTKSRHLRIRELAIEALATHQEVSDLAAEVLAEALASEEAGLVATAAEALHAHPELAMVLAASEKRAGLDPRSPPPSRTPKKERSRKVDEALGAALKKTFPEDRFETRIALIEALTSLEHPGAKVAAEGACVDANPVVRSRALRALRTMGAGIEACSGQPRALAPAPELEGLLTKPTRIVLETEATELAIVLDPALSPRAASRIASLVQTGFYDGIEVHRVVPGFVVQFGDPGGDGYGGSGVSLRCETSPVPFRTLDVGMALAGRDTGSSQLFVTLARTPHLDGAYTRIGHAEGDWARLALHDRIVRARLVE